MSRYLIILCLLVVCGCATGQTTAREQCTPPMTENAWYTQPIKYGLRHDGVLKVGDTTIPMTGFMTLDMERKHAKVVLLTGLGIKIASLTVTPTDYKTIQAGPLVARIPRFMEQCALTIQRSFLSDFPENTDTCVQEDATFTLTGKRHGGTMHATMDTKGKLLSKELVSPSENWKIVYDGTTDIKAMTMPTTITFTSSDRPYQVILQLTDAKIL